MNYDDLTQIVKSTYDDGGSDALINYINNYVNENPNNYEGYLVRSEIYTDFGEFQEAFDDAEKVIKINPKEAVAYNNRGCIYVKSGDDLNKALNDFNKAIELNAKYSDAYSNRGNIYLKMSDFQKAINDFTKSIEFSPNEMEPYYNRGLAYMNVGEIQKALHDYNKVIEIKPTHAETYAKRGGINSELGNTQEAISDFEKFLSLDPNNEKAELIRDALAQLKSGKTEIFKTSINKEQKILFICTAICFVIGTFIGSSNRDTFMGMWFGIGAGVGLSYLPTIPGMFRVLYRSEGFEGALKTTFLGCVIWLIIFMISGPIGFIIRYLKTR